MNNKALWEKVLANLQFSITRARFASFFKESSIVERQGDTVIVGTSNAFSKKWLEDKHHQEILKTLKEISPEIKRISFVVTPKKLPLKSPAVSVEKQQMPFTELQLDPQTGLNVRYTFKDFVVAPFNEMAFAAADAIVHKPLGQVYNPLFVYGGVGLGKTHLLQAIGNELDQEEGFKIKYISAGKLVSMIVNGIRKGEIESLKENFQQLDLLIVDDIQFVAGKEKTQEEFFHIFNALYNKNSQIILSSDRLPNAIPTLAKRLRSRFEGGMVVDIGQPDYESRRAILEAKATEWGLDLGNDILDYVANNIQNNVRELEGALRRLAAYQEVKRSKLDVPGARRVLKDLTRSQAKSASPQKIISCVADHYNLSDKDLLSDTRKKDIAYPRQIAMYLLRKDLRKSYLAIGEVFGGRDHTTVIYACNKIDQEKEKDGRTAHEIELIRQRIYGDQV